MPRDHFRHHPVIDGAAAGLAWGIVARLWMRFISERPEFSWSGTGFIVGASTVVGAALGLAWLRRSRGGRGWWRLCGLAILLLGVGAGSIMIPTVVVAALALGRPWKAWLKAIVLMVSVIPQITIVLPDLDHLAWPRMAVALGVYAVLLWTEARALSIVFWPRLQAASTRPDSPAAAPALAAHPSISAEGGALLD